MKKISFQLSETMTNEEIEEKARSVLNKELNEVQDSADKLVFIPKLETNASDWSKNAERMKVFFGF